MNPFRLKTVLPAVLALAVSIPALPAAELHPFDRTVRLDLWGGTIEQAAAEILAQTGTELAYYRPDFPEDGTNRKIHLVTGDVPLRLVLECLSRFFACRYRLSESGRIEMARGYQWVGTEFVLRFNDADELSPVDGDTARIEQSLREFLRVLPLLSGKHSLAFERQPAPEGRTRLKAIAVLPPALADYFDRAVLCLKADCGEKIFSNGLFPPEAVEIQPAAWSRLLAEDLDLGTTAGDPRGLMREISARLGIAFLLNGVPAAGTFSGPPSGRTSLGRATERLAETFGLPRRVFLNPGAVIFESGKKGDWEEDGKSREFRWTGLAVRGFDARRAAERVGADELLGRLRRAVFPEIWFDPLCALAYSSRTGRLAVIAPANVFPAIAEELRKFD